MRLLWLVFLFGFLAQSTKADGSLQYSFERLSNMFDVFIHVCRYVSFRWCDRSTTRLVSTAQISFEFLSFAVCCVKLFLTIFNERYNLPQRTGSASSWFVQFLELVVSSCLFLALELNYSTAYLYGRVQEQTRAQVCFLLPEPINITSPKYKYLSFYAKATFSAQIIIFFNFDGALSISFRPTLQTAWTKVHCFLCCFMF